MNSGLTKLKLNEGQIWIESWIEYHFIQLFLFSTMGICRMCVCLALTDVLNYLAVTQFILKFNPDFVDFDISTSVKMLKVRQSSTNKKSEY